MLINIYENNVDLRKYRSYEINKKKICIMVFLRITSQRFKTYNKHNKCVARDLYKSNLSTKKETKSSLS